MNDILDVEQIEKSVERINIYTWGMIMKLSDVKAITLNIGNGGIIAMSFNEETGHLRMWINDAIKKAPANSKKYPLSPTISNFSIYDHQVDDERDIRVLLSS